MFEKQIEKLIESIGPLKVLVELTNDLARIPTKGTSQAACFDVYACEDASVEFGKVTIIDLGIKISIPKGYEMVVRPRSSFGFKHGLAIHIGTIDSDYRGPMKIAMFSMNKEHEAEYLYTNKGMPKYKDNSFKIKCGDRIAQVKLQRVHPTIFVESKVNNDTERGEGGFGSTGN